MAVSKYKWDQATDYKYKTEFIAVKWANRFLKLSFIYSLLWNGFHRAAFYSNSVYGSSQCHFHSNHFIP